MSVARAQEEVSSREFVEWIAWEEMEPVCEERMDLRFAWLMDTIASSAGAKRAKIGESFLRAMDFANSGQSQQTAEQMKAVLMGFTKQVTVMANG
ncbi:hypothetical protein LCGC14_1590030 [marine sediment metagenome]|uniref:Minor tail T domain-containing protein n=1 Tax=marine sediment metagenome TaxID=412755 RepID=A0A0F9KUY7_9ZZZZ